MHSIIETLLAFAQRRAILLDQSYRPRTREFAKTLAGQKLIARLRENHDSYHSTIREMEKFKDALSRIGFEGNDNDKEPRWRNKWLPGLDAMYLYALIRTKQPRTYLEIGSGNSTKFVRRAIKDGNLATRIISIDPSPRTRIDALCDVVIRQRFEDVDAGIYLNCLASGDVVFIDGSHRSFQSSDVTVFFTETLPALPAGLIYGIHDIFIPFDYPVHWRSRFYNEQYLLLAYMFGGQGNDEVLFPGAYISTNALFTSAINTIFDSLPFPKIERHAVAFWLRRGA